MKKWRVAALVAREHGWAALQSLESHPSLEIVAIATHRLLTRSEDPSQGQRPDFIQFEQFAKNAGCPLLTVDSRAEQQSFEEKMLSLGQLKKIIATSSG